MKTIFFLLIFSNLVFYQTPDYIIYKLYKGIKYNTIEEDKYGYMTPNLGKGLWRNDNILLKEISKCDSLKVFYGIGFRTNRHFIDSIPPNFYWKYVKSLTTGKTVLCRIYTNTGNTNISREYSKEGLEELLNIKIK